MYVEYIGDRIDIMIGFETGFVVVEYKLGT